MEISGCAWGDPHSGADLTERGPGCAIKYLGAQKMESIPFFPKSPSKSPSLRWRHNSGYPQVVEKAKFPSLVCSPLIQPRLGELSFPCWDLGEGAGQGELGMQLAQPKNNPQHSWGRTGLTPFIQQPQTLGWIFTLQAGLGESVFLKSCQCVSP